MIRICQNSKSESELILEFVSLFFQTEPMSQFQFFDQRDLDFVFPTFIRGVSDENLLSSFFCPRQQNVELTQLPPKQPLIEQGFANIPQFCKFVKAKDQKKNGVIKQKKDYKKNICGYITKKIVREFMNQIYKQKVMDLCLKYGCNYQDCIKYYDRKIERITGPTHLDMLLNASKQAPNMKRCFKQFFIWFLRHRYLRYLITQGKMERKDIYIDYKNKTLLYLGSIDQNFLCNTNCNEPESKQTSSIFTN